MFFKRKKSYVLDWSNEQMNSTRHSTNKIKFEDILKSMMHCVSMYGNNRKNKVLYNLINENAFFEIACYYFVRTDLHVFMFHPNERPKIQRLFNPFYKIFSKALNKSEDEIQDLLNDRITVYTTLFKDSNLGIDNLVQIVYESESSKDNKIIGDIWPKTLHIQDVFYDTKVKTSFYTLDKHVLNSYLDTIDNLIKFHSPL